MGKVNSLDKIKQILPNNDDLSIKNNWRKIKKHPNHKPHQEYSEWVYVSNIKKVLLDDFTDDLDFWWIPWKKWDLVVSAGTKEEDITTTLKSFEKIWKILEDNRNEILDTLHIPVPTHSHNKIINRCLNEQNFQDFYTSVDLSNKKMEEKVYMWSVSDVHENSLTVCIGSTFWQHPVEYDIPFDRLPDSMKGKNFHIWLSVFVDVKKDVSETTLTSRKYFDQPRLDELKRMGIEINWYKPVFYKTTSWKIYKWKIIWLWDDVFGEQVVFQTKEGKKFPITLRALKKWIEAAKLEYQKKKSVSSETHKKPVLVKKTSYEKQMEVA